MLNNINKAKSILSKLIVATKCFKKVLPIQKTKTSLIILELLQEAGLVYGYTICSYNSNTYIIFLKYSENTNSSLKNVLFLNKRLCFKNRNTFAKNSLYLILNKKGFFISTVDNKSVSGYVIARF